MYNLGGDAEEAVTSPHSNMGGSEAADDGISAHHIHGASTYEGTEDEESVAHTQHTEGGDDAEQQDEEGGEKVGGVLLRCCAETHTRADVMLIVVLFVSHVAQCNATHPQGTDRDRSGSVQEPVRGGCQRHVQMPLRHMSQHQPTLCPPTYCPYTHTPHTPRPHRAARACLVCWAAPAPVASVASWASPRTRPHWLQSARQQRQQQPQRRPQRQRPQRRQQGQSLRRSPPSASSPVASCGAQPPLPSRLRVPTRMRARGCRSGTPSATHLARSAATHLLTSQPATSTGVCLIASGFVSVFVGCPWWPFLVGRSFHTPHAVVLLSRYP